MKIAFLILPIAFLSLVNNAHAFPDSVRHGYTHCSACHVSPAGGGLLSKYGRNLSTELFSTWSYSDEEKLGHGILKSKGDQSKNLHFGGDIRYLNRSSENKTATTDEGFLMQAQLKLALQYEKFQLFLSLGEIENPRQTSEVRWISPEYFLLFSPGEETFVRAGRFEPMYGLRLPEHNLLVKQETSFVPWQQRDAVELAQQGENLTLAVAGFQSTDGQALAQQNTGYIFSAYYTVFDTFRLGFNFLNAEGQDLRRRSTTVSGVLPWTKMFFSSVEISRVANNGAESAVALWRNSYEMFKGFIPYLQFQGKREFGNTTMNRDQYGVGLLWLPRPHWEFQFSSEWIHQTMGGSQEMFLMSHYYF